MNTAVESLKSRGAIYERLGVKPIINAIGTWTDYGGSIMEPEVMQAMIDASRVMVRMRDLNECAGEMIAKYTHAEAGLVTAGAADAMLLQAATCITGKDPAKIKRLPDTEGMKNEIIIKWGHNDNKVQLWRAAGAKLVWVGSSSSGGYKGRSWEIEAAINEKSIALAFLASKYCPDSFDSLDEMVRIARHHDVPVIVDAAAMLPPVENLWRFIDHGADMVAFSGGKSIRGPQSTGILCGRRDLIEAAALNHSPNGAIGRAAKVCKEEIVGLMVALERYIKRDHAADQRRWREQCNTIAAAIMDIRGVKTAVLQDDWTQPIPELSIHLTSDWTGPSPDMIIDTMAKGDPPIIIGGGVRWGEQLFVNPQELMEEETELIGQRLRAVMIMIEK